MNEVVFYDSWGKGFKISKKAVEYMAELGSQKAKDLLKDHDNSFFFTNAWYEDNNRYDPYLIKAVKNLGDEAGYNLSIKIIKGDKFKIFRYDGLEEVLTPDEIKWNKIEKK